MLEITSTPLVLIAILGTVGIILPIISIARKEQGSNSFYAVIAFAALIALPVLHSFTTNQVEMVIN